jgi:rubrerythrin
MADMAMIQSAIGSIKIASEIAVGLVNLRTMSEVQSKAIELNQKLIEAQHSIFAANAAQSALVEEVRGLKEELVRVKAWESEKQRYKLATPWTGALMYALKESMNSGEPPHWICTKCYQDGRKSILNGREERGKDRAHLATYNCPVCKSSVEGEYGNVVAATYAPE